MFFHSFYRARAFGFQLVRHGDYADNFIVFRNVQRGFAVPRELFARRESVVCRRADIFHKGGVSDDDFVAAHDSFHAVSRKVFKLFRGENRYVFFFRKAHDRRRKRVRTAFFKACGKRDDFVFGLIRQSRNVGDDRRAFRYGARLVQNDDICFSRFFKGGCRLEQKSVFRAFSAADHNGDGGCKT